MGKLGKTRIEVRDGKLTKVTPTLNSIVEELDKRAPKIDRVDYAIFDKILNHCDFSKTKNAFESIKLFYEQMWMHVIFRVQDENHLLQKDVGKYIIEADEWRRKAEKAEEELKLYKEKYDNGRCV